MGNPATFAPSFKIEIGGGPIQSAMRGCVTGITFQNGIEGASRVEVALANPGLRWLDDPTLALGSSFSLWLGYASAPLEKVFVGEITGVNATFPSGGMPMLTVVAHDFLQQLTTGSRTRSFALDIPCIGVIPLPDVAVASLVSLEDLLLPFPDPVGGALSFLFLALSYIADPLETRKAVRVQQDESDFEFLTKIAKDNGWEMYIDHTLDPQGYVLRFQFIVQSYTPSLVLKYGTSLIEFNPRISNVGQVAGVSTRIWVAALQTELVLVVSWNYDRASFDIEVYTGLNDLDSIMGSDARSVVKIDAIGPGTAPRELLSDLLPRLNNRLTGSGSTIGDLRIRAGNVIDLEGLGGEFSGKYRITSCTHTINSEGYRTSFEARKEVWFGSTPLPKGAGGLFRIQGKTIG